MGYAISQSYKYFRILGYSLLNESENISEADHERP